MAWMHNNNDDGNEYGRVWDDRRGTKTCGKMKGLKRTEVQSEGATVCCSSGAMCNVMVGWFQGHALSPL